MLQCRAEMQCDVLCGDMVQSGPPGTIRALCRGQGEQLLTRNIRSRILKFCQQHNVPVAVPADTGTILESWPKLNPRTSPAVWLPRTVSLVVLKIASRRFADARRYNIIRKNKIEF